MTKIVGSGGSGYNVERLKLKEFHPLSMSPRRSPAIDPLLGVVTGSDRYFPVSLTVTSGNYPKG
jgi:hypothetical protein